METKKIKKMNWLEKIYTDIQKPGMDVKTNFFRLLALGQRAGLGLRESLLALENSEKNAAMRAIIHDLIEQINQGLTLGKAMNNHKYFFVTEEREMIASAEMTGKLPETLDSISLDLEENQKINNKIKGAMTYPIILMAVTVIAVVVLLKFVMPTIVSIFPSSDQLPLVTKLMIGVSGFVDEYRMILVIGVMSLVAGHKYLMKNIHPYKVFWDGLFLKIPVIRDLIKTYYMYRFSKNFADFYRAGVSPVVALDHIGSIFENFFYKRKVYEIKKNTEGGFSLSDSLDGSNLFDPLLIQIIDVGETTGNIDEVLSRASDFYKDQLSVNIAQLMTFVEPAMMLLIAAVVGTVVAAVFVPMAGLLQYMK